MTSCSADVEQDTVGREPIRFTAGGLTVTTRAASTDDLQQTAFAAGEEVAVYVEDCDNSETYDATPYPFRAEAASDGKNALTYTDGTLPYPQNAASSINVFAFYPYRLFMSESNHSKAAFPVSVATDQSSADSYRASDVMRATPVENHPRSTNAIHLQFAHLMAQVAVRLKQGQHKGTTSISQTADELAGSTMTLGNGDISTAATIDLSTGVVTTTGTSATITLAKNCDLTFYDAGTPTVYAVVLPPQDISGTLLTIRTGYGRTITGTLPAVSLSGGNSQVLNVTVNDTYLTVAVAPTIGIGEWTKYNWIRHEDK